jgi:segregation and condensation protein A
MMVAAGKAEVGGDKPFDALWEEDRAISDASLVVDVSGFEGPLDLLLHLARGQKVDLARISVRALADQYLEFVRTAQGLRIELAADYLVMAAWLAFLKSKLLFPKTENDGGESGEELAAVLQFRLKRLEAMREAASRLINRNRLGRDFFARGMPEAVIIDRSNKYSATLYDLLTAYAAQRQKKAVSHVSVGGRFVWSLKEARTMLMRMIGEVRDWTALDQYLLAFIPQAERATAMASSFAASLEMAREGEIEIRQDAAFEPLYMRKKNMEVEGAAGHG